MPAGPFGFVIAACVPAQCLVDSDCNARAGGECLPFFSSCDGGIFGCHYPGDPCRTDADCPGARFPEVCTPQPGQGTLCVESPPRP